MGIETLSFEPEDTNVYEQQAIDLAEDRKRVEERNSGQQHKPNETTSDKEQKDPEKNSENITAFPEVDGDKIETTQAEPETINVETEIESEAPQQETAERIPDSVVEILDQPAVTPKPDIKIDMEKPLTIEGEIINPGSPEEQETVTSINPAPSSEFGEEGKSINEAVVETTPQASTPEPVISVPDIDIPTTEQQVVDTPAVPIEQISQPHETTHVMNPAFVVTERQTVATSAEGIEWQKRESELKSDLYEKSKVWKDNPTNGHYLAYISSYDSLAQHNTKVWHNDELTKEGVYGQYITSAQKPLVDKVGRSILMSGNLYFNQASPDKIKDSELEDIAKTLMWERLKNPAVVDFEFAQGFRVNLWVMRPETRRLLEEKILALGGNNYAHMKPASASEQNNERPQNENVGMLTNLEQVENSQEVTETSEQELEEEPETENEETRYAQILKRIRKNGIANNQDKEEWAETIDHLLELHDSQKARELAQEKINGADNLTWEGDINNKMVNALILAAAIRKREEMQKASKSQEDQEIFLEQYLNDILGQDADKREVAEFLRQVKELKNVHA